MSYRGLTKAQLVQLLQERDARDAGQGEAHTEPEAARLQLEAQARRIHDLQARLDSLEAQRSQLYDFGPVGFVTLDAQGRVAALSLPAATILGQPRAELLGRSFALFVDRQDRKRFRAHLEQTVAGLRSSTALRILRPQEPAYVLFLSARDSSTDRRSGLYQIALVDISDRQSSEEHLRRSAYLLEEKLGERTAELVRTVDLLERQVDQRLHAEAELTRFHEQLRALSSRLLSIQEDERRRIAREVHDELGQTLTALKFDLAWLNQRLGPAQAELQAKVQKMTGFVDDTIHMVRRIATALRPRLLDDFGLVAALEWQVRDFQERTGIVCKLDCQEIELDAERSTAVFRISQEALTNVARHAGARNVEIHLAADEQTLRLSIRDDGRGITRGQQAARESLGLLGMRERVLPFGGEVHIHGTPGKGTLVQVRIPRLYPPPGNLRVYSVLGAQQGPKPSGG